MIVGVAESFDIINYLRRISPVDQERVNSLNATVSDHCKISNIKYNPIFIIVTQLSNDISTWASWGLTLSNISNILSFITFTAKWFGIHVT